MSFLQKQLSDGVGFGRDFRELRELRGLSREELAARTHIHPTMIAALEEERIHELNDPAYAERHVRTIVIALEGRSGYYLKKYRDMLVARQAVQAERMIVRPLVRRRDFFVLSRAVALFGFLFLMAIAAGYLIWQGRLLKTPPTLTIMSPQEGERVPVPRVLVRGSTDASASVRVNGREAVVDRTGEFQVSFDLPRGMTTLTIESRRRFGSVSTVTRRVTYERESPSVSADDAGFLPDFFRTSTLMATTTVSSFFVSTTRAATTQK